MIDPAVTCDTEPCSRLNHKGEIAYRFNKLEGDHVNFISKFRFII